ncbi:helix-turn-helix domain-containing protein [Bisgaard Taxon 45]
MWTLIKDKAQYNAAMDRIIELADSELVENTPEFDEFELLSLLIKHYEDKKYPPVKTDPVRVIKFFMDQNNLSNRDMVQYLGSYSRVSEILNYKRKLTLNMIRKLTGGLNIPSELLIPDYELLTTNYDIKPHYNILPRFIQTIAIRLEEVILVSSDKLQYKTHQVQR